MSEINNLRSITTTTYKEQAYEIVKEAILYRKFKPGEIYSQDSICNELGISRTPVREALLELSKDGYLTFLRGRGVEILGVDKKEAKDIVELRRILEVEGCKLAAERASEEQKRNIKYYVDRMYEEIRDGGDPILLYKTDREFHHSIIAATGNNWLLNILEKCRDHYLRVESQTAFDSITQSENVALEHKEIYEAILHNNCKLAEETMRKHLDRTADRTLRVLSTVDYK